VIRAVIFDCDGVLVDSEALSNRALSEALAEAGLAMSPAECRVAFMGRSWASCLELIEERLGAAAPSDLEDAYRARMHAAFERELRPVPGIEGALDAIELPVCVASSGPPSKIRHSLGLTGLLPRFEGSIFSAVEVARGKPAPDLFLHAAARMGWESATCAVVEDAPVGVEAAAAAGMTAFGYAGDGDAPALEAAGARVFTDMSELPELLSRPSPSRSTD
jgi:HAD superfamily hydrolase (TIGR01509 family)